MDVKVWNSIVSDLLINLSAGWIGAIWIVPNFSEKSGKQKLAVLTMNIFFATFCLAGAYLFRIL